MTRVEIEEEAHEAYILHIKNGGYGSKFDFMNGYMACANRHLMMKAWIARDKNGAIYLYSSKPTKGCEFWRCCSDNYFPITGVPEDTNPQWEDEEPIEVELKIGKKI